MSRPIELLLEELLMESAKQLLLRIKSGEWDAKDMKEARELLRDNHINVDVKKGEPLAILAETLPFEEFDTPLLT